MRAGISAHSKLSVLVFLLFFLLLSGCGKPYPQFSIEQLKFIQGIRTAANTKSKKRLDAVEKAIDQAKATGTVTPELEKILTSLLEECHNENYDQAEKKCVLLLKDQLRK
jgi:hypothetical protein